LIWAVWFQSSKVLFALSAILSSVRLLGIISENRLGFGDSGSGLLPAAERLLSVESMTVLVIRI
jgi:hypothetical protein